MHLPSTRLIDPAKIQAVDDLSMTLTLGPNKYVVLASAAALSFLTALYAVTTLAPKLSLLATCAGVGALAILLYVASMAITIRFASRNFPGGFAGFRGCSNAVNAAWKFNGILAAKQKLHHFTGHTSTDGKDDDATFLAQGEETRADIDELHGLLTQRLKPGQKSQ